MGVGRLLLGALACLPVVAGCDAAETAPAPDETPVTTTVTTTAENDFDVTDPVLLQSTWWTWAASAPEATNPVSDPTGEDCDRDQRADVWLLAGSFGETLTRRCTVPAGVPLAAPVINLVADTPGSCDAFLSGAEGSVTLDGAELPLRTADPVEITYQAVAGNPVTVDGGTFGGYACGLWFSHPGLEPGENVLTIDGSSSDFSVSVTYELTVTARTG